MPTIHAIQALSDNYIWAIVDAKTQQAIIVDPGQAQPVESWLEAQGLSLAAIFITHHHHDHTQGIDELIAQRDIAVYGPKNDSVDIPGLTRPLVGGDHFTIGWLGIGFDVIAVPGHTQGHIVYYADDMLFSGDALFRGGCGRLFEGSPEQMQPALAQLRALPEQTLVYAGHEYTLKNLSFAQHVEPDNAVISEVFDSVSALREKGHPSLPGILGEEKQINPFLRWDEPAVKAAAQRYSGQALQTDAAVFGALRAWKDHF